MEGAMQVRQPAKSKGTWEGKGPFTNRELRIPAQLTVSAVKDAYMKAIFFLYFK